MSQLEIHSLVDKLQYTVLSTFTVSRFLQSPITDLYRELKPLYRSSYTNRERIVLIDDVKSSINKSPFYNYFQRLLTHLDITNCFVLVIGNDDTRQLLNDSHKYAGHDTTCIEFINYTIPCCSPATITDFSLPNTICVNPWINIELSTSGILRPCCVYKYSGNTRYPSIKNLPIDRAIDDSIFKELRKKMRNGELIDGCKECHDDENAGKLSKRQRDNYVFRDSLFDIDWNQTDRTQLLSLDLKLKNLCNLSCRICSPVQSSKWYDEVSKNPDVYRDINLKIVKTDWRTDEFDMQMWNDFTKTVHNIKYVTFAGGEPLLDKAHISLLKYFINNGTSKNISLHYNSNGTVFAEKLIPIWDKFNSVEISFSIDNIGARFEYERYGSSWNTVLECLTKYKQLSSDTYKFNMYSTVNVLNILDAYNLYRFSKKMNLPITFNILDEPFELSISILNKIQKKYANKFFDEIVDDEFHHAIDPILTHMNNSSSTITTDNLETFLKKTDAVRDQDFRKVYPELVKLINRRF